MRAEAPDSPDYEAIFREYAPKVRALAARRLPGRDVSDDVVQEVFIRAFRALPELDLDRPLWPWLRRVCLNVCTDVLRSPRTWAEHPVDELPDMAAPAGVDPVSVVMADEQRRAIADALETLAPRQREALLRRVVDGASSEDLAAGEQSSVEAVKSAVKRGRHLFRRAYTDIANERGLLGAPPTPAFHERLFLRLRAVVNECARICNDVPAWQSVPVAVTAALLGLGLGAIQNGSGPAGADVDRRGGSEWAMGSGGAGGAGAGASAGSPSSTARPGGGGTPPSSPPGRDRNDGNGGANPPAARAWVASEFTGRENDNYWVGLRASHLPQHSRGMNLEAGTGIDMHCDSNAARSTACSMLRQMPSEVPGRFE